MSGCVYLLEICIMGLEGTTSAWVLYGEYLQDLPVILVAFALKYLQVAGYA